MSGPVIIENMSERILRGHHFLGRGCEGEEATEIRVGHFIFFS